jgi:S-adenosylmethionine-dependent methyltransferase
MPHITALYGQDPDREWARLDQDPFHRLEYDTTLHFLAPLLPRAGQVLDAGGGPGRYAIALARRGLQITLLDLTPELLTIARREAAQAGVGAALTIEQGNIVDLSRYADGQFDASLCLGGPLSHVRTIDARQRAVDELARVTRPGGLVAISVMGRLAVVIEAPANWPQEIAAQTSWRRLWRDGEDERFVAKFYCHFFLAEELEALLEAAGLEVLQRVGLEGIGSHDWDAINRLATEEPTSYRHWLEAHLALAVHPAIVATSGHILMIARKGHVDEQSPD